MQKCNNSGYYDRIGIFEVLVLSDEIRELIVNNNSAMEIRKAALKSGYQPLIIDGIKK